jgi:hypothetical protein
MLKDRHHCPDAVGRRVPSRRRPLWPAMRASVACASSIGASGGKPLTRIWKKWSMVQMLSMPASSAMRAMRTTVGPISEAGRGHEKLVTPMPIFTAFLRVPLNKCDRQFKQPDGSTRAERHPQAIATQYGSSLRDGSHQLPRPRYLLFHALMRALLVVVLDELPEQVFQMTLPELARILPDAVRKGGRPWPVTAEFGRVAEPAVPKDYFTDRQTWGCPERDSPSRTSRRPDAARRPYQDASRTPCPLDRQ